MIGHTRVLFHSASPFFHRAGVKEVRDASTGYIKENNNSLSSFTYSPVCARATPARAYMRVCVRGGGEGGKEAKGQLHSPEPSIDEEIIHVRGKRLSVREEYTR